MIILKRHGIMWKERKLIKGLNQNQKVKINYEVSEEIETGKGLRQLLSQHCSTWYKRNNS